MTLVATKKPTIGILSGSLSDVGIRGVEATFIDVGDPNKMSGLDGLVVGAEISQRCRVIEAAVEAGVPAILCESPLAANLEEAHAIVGLCERRAVCLAVAFAGRYSPAFQRLREQVRAGAVGEILAIRSTSHGLAIEENGGDALLDRATQTADLNWWLLGREATEVYAETSNRFYGSQGEDAALLTIKYGDIFATLDARWSHSKSYPAGGEITFQVVGTGGVLELDMFSQGLAVSSAKDGRISWPGWGSDVKAGMLSDFARQAVGENVPNLATGGDAVRALEIAFAAYRSAERQEPVAVGRQ